MPITFRCPSCRNRLSTAKRKAGSLVKCPGCGGEVRVPTANEKLDPQVERLLTTAGGRAEYEGEAQVAEPDDPTPDFGPKADSPPPEPPPQPKPPAARRATPTAKPASPPTPSKLNDLPLFEREDFAEMLEQDAEEEEDEPLPLPKEPPATPADGFLVTRGTATLVMVAVVVLLGLAFAAGFLVGNRG